MASGRYPITVQHRDVRRILAHDARTLILIRAHSPGPYELHDALVVQRNEQHRHGGRPDLQSDPCILTVEVLDVRDVAFGDIDFSLARAAGYRGVQDLQDDWMTRRRIMDADIVWHVHIFEVVDQRFLHRQVHRGYTVQPHEAALDEGAALSPAELEKMAAANRARFEAERHTEIRRKRGKSLAALWRRALNQGDITAAAAIRQEMEKAEKDLAA